MSAKNSGSYYRKNAKDMLKRDTDRYRKNEKAIADKYHIQKNLKHDAADRMRKQDPRVRKR